MSSATIIAPSEAAKPTTGTSGGAALFRQLATARAALASAARAARDTAAAQASYSAARSAFLAHEPDARESLTLTVPASKSAPEHRRTLPVREAQSLVQGNVPTTLSVLFRSKVL